MKLLSQRKEEEGGSVMRSLRTAGCTSIADGDVSRRRAVGTGGGDQRVATGAALGIYRRIADADHGPGAAADGLVGPQIRRCGKSCRRPVLLSRSVWKGRGRQRRSQESLSEGGLGLCLFFVFLSRSVAVVPGSACAGSTAKSR